jgi:hypothetical protein
MAQQQIRELPNLTIRNLEFMYKPNFSGEAEKYNDAGNRYFNAKIDPEIAEALQRDGWNIKWSKPGANHPNPEEHVSEPYVEVTVGFKFRPPTIVMIRDQKVTPITEGTVSLLDSTEFSKIDVVIRPRYWENENGSGYKAWLKSFYGTVEMDELDRDYAHLQPGFVNQDDAEDVSEEG